MPEISINQNSLYNWNPTIFSPLFGLKNKKNTVLNHYWIYEILKDQKVII